MPTIHSTNTDLFNKKIILNAKLYVEEQATNGYAHNEAVRNGKRALNIADACARYQNRFTMEHVPTWAKVGKIVNGVIKYPGPSYINAQEWYKKTEFIGFGTNQRKYCRSKGLESYPCGRWLDQPYVAGVTQPLKPIKTYKLEKELKKLDEREQKAAVKKVPVAAKVVPKVDKYPAKKAKRAGLNTASDVLAAMTKQQAGKQPASKAKNKKKGR